jgi:hypothetical protein
MLMYIFKIIVQNPLTINDSSVWPFYHTSILKPHPTYRNYKRYRNTKMKFKLPSTKKSSNYNLLKFSAFLTWKRILDNLFVFFGTTEMDHIVRTKSQSSIFVLFLSILWWFKLGSLGFNSHLDKWGHKRKTSGQKG